MNIKIEEDFLKALLDISPDLTWDGREKKSGIYGSFVGYIATSKGFKINIAKHDYRGGKNRSFRMAARRNVGQDDDFWIEISVDDEHARFGRRSILKRAVYVPTDPFFEIAESIFNKAEELGEIFCRFDSERLSDEQAMRAFTLEISK